MDYIKSHSNYVLKKRHQEVQDGTIYERDVTTIGGVGDFPLGQIPIYRSNNFILTVNGSSAVATDVPSSRWYGNDSGDTWTLVSLEPYVSEDKSEDTNKIVVKQDYTELRDFAYYGSLSERMRAAITHIISTFPGELYAEKESKPILWDDGLNEDGTPRQYVLGLNDCAVSAETMPVVHNPFKIDIHSKRAVDGAKELAFFCDGGYENYVLIDDNGSETEIDTWQTEIFYAKAYRLCQVEPNRVNDPYYVKSFKDVFSEYAQKYGLTEEEFADAKNTWEAQQDERDAYSNKWYVVDIELNGGDLYSYNGESFEPTYHEECSSEHEARDLADRLNEEAQVTKYYVRKADICDELNCYFGPLCVGDKFAEITINYFKVGAWYGNNFEIAYIPTEDSSQGMDKLHIRPKKIFLDAFYNQLDDFERILLNPNTSPRYKASFTVVKDNEYGYYKNVETFIYPTSEGGYNIDSSTFGFNDYTSRMASIGEYYDSFLSDCLWRSMTHEAIKNFDWTHQRYFQEGDEDEFIFGGERIQKVIRLYGREFDEVKTYIDGIGRLRKVTYGGEGDTPDYFLTDLLEGDGWDVRMAIPFDLVEKNSSGDQLSEDVYSDYQAQLDNKYNGDAIVRHFSQNQEKIIKPYDYSENELGAYYMLSDCESGTTADDCIKDLICPFHTDIAYSYGDANNEFLRRLKLNSRAIWRKKGTVDGIESILAMFGLKSARFVGSEDGADYKITEYSSLTSRIEETWDAVHQMYRIDWVNSTKLINYDNRGVTNPTVENSSDKTSYIGIPVASRYAEENDGDLYLSMNGTTNDANEAYRYLVDGRMGEENYVRRRFLYPCFNKGEQLDGNPYFQMNGGWGGLRLSVGSDEYINFSFDDEDNIVYGYNTFEPLYRETYRPIQSVNTLDELLSIPYLLLQDKTICYVRKVANNIAIIDGKIYPINFESKNGQTLMYVSLYVDKNTIEVGSARIYGAITVYDSTDSSVTYDLTTKGDGYELKAYIKGGTDFMAKSPTDYSQTIMTFGLFTDANTSAYTNYFVLDDRDGFGLLQPLVAEDDAFGMANGWRRLTKEDYDYKRQNVIQNYYKGNNPHRGDMSYDGGSEYFKYFERLFRYPIAEDLFDDRCYDDLEYAIQSEIGQYGFKGLVDEDFLIEDTKIHYFGNYITSDGGRNLYGDGHNKYNYFSGTTIDSFSGYQDMRDVIIHAYESAGLEIKPSEFDSVTNLIMNNKKLKITFFLKNKWYSNDGLCEMKYLDDVVIPYMTELLPSTVIFGMECDDKKCYTKPKITNIQWSH